MILHCVFCNFRADAPVAQREQVLQDLAALSRSLDGVLGFDFGPNRDFEKKSQSFSDGFVIRFANPDALQHYAIHPDHQRLGGQLCDLCEGGADGIIVFDLETG